MHFYWSASIMTRATIKHTHTKDTFNSYHLKFYCCCHCHSFRACSNIYICIIHVVRFRLFKIFSNYQRMLKTFKSLAFLFLVNHSMALHSTEHILTITACSDNKTLLKQILSSVFNYFAEINDSMKIHTTMFFF